MSTIAIPSLQAACFTKAIVYLACVQSTAYLTVLYSVVKLLTVFVSNMCEISSGGERL